MQKSSRVNWHLHDLHGLEERSHYETVRMAEVGWLPVVGSDGSKQVVFLRLGAPKLKAVGAHWYRSESS
jgi:hypothetical protein